MTLAPLACEGYRLSPQQRRCWLLSIDPAVTHAQCAVLLTGELDVTALRRAANGVVARHESLRTLFHAPPGARVPLQVIAEVGAAAWEEIELDLGPESLAASALDELLEREARRPFALATGPLVRALLVRTGDRLRHLLVLTLPALCADAVSLRNLTREIAGVYAQDSPAAGETVQYLQFSEWQWEVLESEPAPAPAGWAAAGSQTPALPGERHPAAGAASTPQRIRAALEASAVEQLEEARLRCGVGLPAFLLAAWELLLFRLAGEAVPVQWLADGRPFAELAEAVGLFSTALPLLPIVDADLPFAQLAARCDELLAAALRQPEDLARQAAASSADESDLPVALELRSVPPAVCRAGVEFSLLDEAGGAERAKLRLVARLGPRQLALEVWYDSARFDAGAARMLLDRALTVLAAVSRRPAAPVGDVELLSADERRQVLVDFNATARDLAVDRTVYQLFAEQARRVPDRPALADDHRRLTYSQLAAAAAALGERLRRAGVGPEVRVGTFLERSIDVVVALLATWHARGAFVPLEPSSPRARIATLLEEAGVDVLVTAERSAGALAAGSRALVLLDPPAAGEAGGAPTPAPALKDSLAYVLFTSGSTGTPKAVAVEHRQLTDYVLGISGHLALPEGWSYAFVSAFTADLGHTVLFPALCSGGCLHILAADRLASPDGVAEYFRREGIDCLKITPSHLKALLLAREPRHVLPRRLLVLGGEALSWDLVAQVRQLAPGCRIVNHYGPTEATVGVLARPLQPAEASTGAVPLGGLLPNARVYLLDARLHPVPAGVTGQLCLGGGGVARGYLGRPDATAAKFLPDPFTATPGSRMYTSGDLARFAGAADLEFLGRADDQVKVRGFRVELGEIEAVLAGHPAVRECVVVARQDGAGDRRLAAYVAAAGDPPPDREALRAFLLERLPEVMVPADLVLVPKLPLNANGKVDRRLLTDLLDAAAQGGTRVLPRDVVELGLARLWEDLLGVRPIGVRDNFFALGGHSLLAVRLMVQVRNQFGCELPLGTLVTRGATVEGLASLLRSGGHAPSFSALVEIQPGCGRDPLFCVHPSGGTVLCYLDLSRHLGADQPVFGLQARGREGGGEPLTRVEEMAADYLQAVRSVQPRGPYRLAGWSFGGVVAFEMAQQLRATGERVALLAILDSDFRTDCPLLNDAEFLVELLGEELGLALDDLRRYHEVDELLAHAAAKARALGLLREELGPADLRRLFHFYKTTYNAARAYRPAAYPAPITLLLSEQWTRDGLADPTFGLRGLATGGLETVVVPARHVDFVRQPAVVTVAAHLRRCLDRAAASPGPNDDRL
jgi:amino acid adenylation domain-containing protein